MKNNLKTKITLVALIGMLVSAGVAMAGNNCPSVTVLKSSTNDIFYSNHAPITKELIAMVEHNSDLKFLLEKSIAMAKKINPDKDTNPAQSLEEYYDYIDWASKAMPWEILPCAGKRYAKIYDSIGQSLGYFCFLNDMLLPELEGRGLYRNSVQYMEPYRSWMVNFIAQYGFYLDTPESWNNDCYERAKLDKSFGLDDDTYESPENWHSFNDFFSRRLSSPDKRPVASPDDRSVLASPADSQPQGIWKINKKNHFEHHKNVDIKSRDFTSVEQLLADSAYKGAFAGGILTHTYLDTNDYHHYHFPVSGVIKEVKIIGGDDAAGGTVTWLPEKKRYRFKPALTGWQMIETRGLVVIDTDEYGLVAVLPVAMCQISSVVFAESVKVGAVVKKGDRMGCFRFGGSDVAMVFQKGIKLDLTVPKNSKGEYEHINACSQYGVLSNGKSQR